MKTKAENWNPKYTIVNIRKEMHLHCAHQAGRKLISCAHHLGQQVYRQVLERKQEQKRDA